MQILILCIKICISCLCLCVTGTDCPPDDRWPGLNGQDFLFLGSEEIVDLLEVFVVELLH